jgi:CRP/FNR family cyclic AMP-dependent transcriptional regulator
VAPGDDDVHGCSVRRRASGREGPFRFDHCGTQALLAAINGQVSDLVSLLDVDSALAEVVPEDQRAQARQATGALTMQFAAGTWREPLEVERVRGGYGLLVLDGLLLRRVAIEGRHAAELLGPGDLLRPWQHDGSESTLDLEWTWRVVRPTRAAILDPRWAARAAPWPQIGAELAGRALQRSLRLVVAMAIAQQPRLDDRLWMLFWDLADRFGKVHPDGIHLDLPLTHEVLSHLAAARRPSVSGALTRLSAEGRLRRAGRHWVLTGEPPVSAETVLQGVQ